MMCPIAKFVTRLLLKRRTATMFKLLAAIAGVFLLLAPMTNYLGLITTIVSAAVALLSFTAWRPLDDESDSGWWPEKKDRQA
jgi:hypothetical protein